MKIKLMKSALIILFGFVLSSIIYFSNKGYWQDFLHSNIFWTIFMPIFIVGGVLLRSPEDLKIGLFGKILLAILGLIWIFAITTLFIK